MAVPVIWRCLHVRLCNVGIQCSDEKSYSSSFINIMINVFHGLSILMLTDFFFMFCYTQNQSNAGLILLLISFKAFERQWNRTAYCISMDYSPVRFTFRQQYNLT